MGEGGGSFKDFLERGTTANCWLHVPSTYKAEILSVTAEDEGSLSYRNGTKDWLMSIVMAPVI